ncbi:MAG: hypothetical protein COB09_18890 [Thalassobium sp.]|nr:MAG: hypothetical protein COB09_18890 [Thalassobium sp.]
MEKIKCSSKDKAVRIAVVLFEIFKERAIAAGYSIAKDGGIIGKNRLTGKDEPKKATLKMWNAPFLEDDFWHVTNWHVSDLLPELTAAEIARLDAIDVARTYV